MDCKDGIVKTDIQESQEGEEQQLLGDAEQQVSENLALWKSCLKVRYQILLF
jgi:hypothetical protein